MSDQDGNGVDAGRVSRGLGIAVMFIVANHIARTQNTAIVTIKFTYRLTECLEVSAGCN